MAVARWNPAFEKHLQVAAVSFQVRLKDNSVARHYIFRDGRSFNRWGSIPVLMSISPFMMRG